MGDTYIRMPTKRGTLIEVDEEINAQAFLEKLAKDTEGFSGRQLAKLILAMQAAVFGSGTQRLTMVWRRRCCSGVCPTPPPERCLCALNYERNLSVCVFHIFVSRVADAWLA